MRPSAVEPRADPDDRRALLDGDRVVLGRAHRELARGRGARPARAARRTSGGCPRGRSASGGIVIRPARRVGPAQRSRKAGSSPGATPALALLPGDVDLDEDLGLRASRACSSCASADSLATEWISRTCGRTCLTLRLWRWPMKSHVNARRGAACLRSSSCARFSPASVDARPRRAPPSSSSGDVLHRREDLDARRVAAGPRAAAAISSRTRSRFARTRRVEAGDQLRHATPAWRPGAPRSRRWEKNALRIAQIVQTPDVVRPRSRRPPAARARGDGLEVERRGRDGVVPGSAAWTSSPTS